MKLSLIFFPLLLVCFSVAALRADDSATGGVGGAIHMLQGGTNVRMVAEVVHISHLGTKLPKVTARFVFRNDGPPTTVAMGFPESGGGDHGQPDYTDLTNFHSTVDNKPVALRRVVVDRTRNHLLAYDEYTIWWIKRVHFRRGQTRIVYDRYEGGGGGDSIGTQWFTYILRSGVPGKATLNTLGSFTT